jgi:hypothetical protein
MLTILRKSVFLKPITWVLLVSFSTMTSGCYYYRVNKTTEPPASAINRFQDENKLIIVHLDDKVWNLVDIIIDDQFISGNISALPENYIVKAARPDAATRYKKKDSQFLNEVHIYISEFSQKDSSKISIPLRAVQKIEVYDKATGATTASWVFSTIAVGAGVLGVLLIIVILTKSSCPFIYAFDGTNYIFSGEIFSGATRPGLERDDYLALPTLVSSDQNYMIKITNEVHEIQSTNLAELLVFDHPENKSVIIDKYGIPSYVINPVTPVEAITSGNKDLLQDLSRKDTLLYTGTGTEIGKDGIQEIELKFMKPEKSEMARLIIRAKNSFWLDGLISKIHILFGDRFEKYSSKQENTSGKKLREWQLSQNIPLSVFIEKNGKWEFVDYFNIAGPMALRDDVLPLDLKGIPGDMIKIKLVTGYLFWEIDYTAMDFGESEIGSPITIPVESAIDNYKIDIRDLLSDSDSRYYVQKVTGDEALLTFDAGIQQGRNRSVFLHTRGYYKILSEQTGKPDIKKLRTFRKRNSIPAFSKETYDKLSGKTH